MSQQQTRDLFYWAAELGTTTDPREYDQYDPWSGVPDHLTTEPDSRIAPDLEVDRDNGLFYCEDCDRRITRNSRNFNEYGHDTDCRHHQFAGGME